MTLKVVGAIPIIYRILPIDLRKTKLTLNSTKNNAITRNPDFASAWAYNVVTSLNRPLGPQIIRSDFVKFFTKRYNFNKLYVKASKYFFLSPGIILRRYSDPEARHLKKRPKTWVYTVSALKIVTTRPWVVEFSDLFGKKEFLLKRLFKQKIPTSWFLFKAFFLYKSNSKKPRRRIKK